MGLAYPSSAQPDTKTVFTNTNVFPLFANYKCSFSSNVKLSAELFIGTSQKKTSMKTKRTIYGYESKPWYPRYPQIAGLWMVVPQSVVIAGFHRSPYRSPTAGAPRGSKGHKATDIGLWEEWLDGSSHLTVSAIWPLENPSCHPISW